ncbi:hypothetical protein GF367_01275, partial [Candidatus Woesearchaeota archaeon]|nr:hypothetical protein [Candidatus Woesearchaeota archaeon]
LTFGNFGKTICYKGPEESSIEALFKEEVVMELASLSNTEKKFFTQFVLSYVYKWMKVGNVNTTEEFKYAILVDEAHNIFLKDRPTFISETVADVIFREIREYGVSLISLDQHVSKLSDVVAGNSATNVAFQQMLPADIEVISRLMQLQDRKAYFTKLPVGVAIVRLVERHHEPFLVKAPLVKLKSCGVDDAALQDRMKGLLKQSRRREVFRKSVQEEELAKKLANMEYTFVQSGVEPDAATAKEHARMKEAQDAAWRAQERHEEKRKGRSQGIGIRSHLQQKILDDVKKRLSNGESLQDLKKWYEHAGYKRADVLHVFRYVKKKGLERRYGKIQKQEAPELLDLTEDQLALLKEARSRPELPVTALYKAAGFSPRKGNAVRKQLEDLGVVVVESVRTEKGWTKHVSIQYTPELTKILTTS